MKHLFVPYELALKLKLKGFNEPCFGYFFKDTNKLAQGYVNFEDPLHKRLNQCVYAPLYQQVIDWFLENHDIFIEVLVFDRGFLEKNKFCFQYRIYNKSEEWFTGLEFKTINETYNKAIEETLKLI